MSARRIPRAHEQILHASTAAPAGRRRALSTAIAGGALAVLTAVGLAGCGSDETLPNRRPTVEITSGPVDGGTASYSIRISWSGSDPDGFVERFEVAVDPPPEFSEEEIAGRVTEGITEETISGEGGAATVTRVSKTVDGGMVSFDWVHTTEFSRHFRFATPEADSVFENGRQVPTGRFKGMHAVYVRAVDDGGLPSVPDRVAFTAETVAPESEIVRPDVAGDIYILGPRLYVEWTGSDPDGPAPTGYLYKLLRLDTLDPPIPISGVNDPGILYVKGDPEWTPVESEPLDLDLGFPAQYVFGIRAVDEAGAVEPFLDFGRNAFRFQAFESGGRPTLVLSCIAGTFQFRGIAGFQETELPLRTDLEGSLSCSAEEYGGTCDEYRWGVDIPDLEVDEGWSDWSADAVLPPILFESAGVHVLYVQVRDDIGSITMGTLILTVVEFPFDRELLYVDDSFDDLYPRDSQHDDFWRARIQGYGGFDPEGVGEFHAHLDNDRGALSPLVPDLRVLGRYRTVLWETRGSGFNGVSALFKSTAISSRLGLYLAGGGKLWLGGRMVVAATRPPVSGINADLRYPIDDLEPGYFAWNYLKLRNTSICNDRGTTSDGRNNLAEVLPFPGLPEIYPEMQVDTLKVNAAAVDLGISGAEVVCAPLLLGQDPAFRGVVDTLYAYGAVGPLRNPPHASPYDGKPVALRWHDPDPAREHGRIQWFGFPMYYFFDDQAQETFNRSMDWFRKEEPPAGRIGGDHP